MLNLKLSIIGTSIIHAQMELIETIITHHNSFISTVSSLTTGGKRKEKHVEDVTEGVI